jgi:hypothetical protein
MFCSLHRDRISIDKYFNRLFVSMMFRLRWQSNDDVNMRVAFEEKFLKAQKYSLDFFPCDSGRKMIVMDFLELT